MTARYSLGGSTPGNFNDQVAVSSVSETGMIGSSVIDFNLSGGNKGLWYPARSNVSTNRTISVLFRGRITDLASYNSMWGIVGPFAMNTNSLIQYHTNANALQTSCYNYIGTQGVNSSIGDALSSTTYYDWVVTWDGTTSANSFKLYRDGSSIGTVTPTQAWANPLDTKLLSHISLGNLSGLAYSKFKLEEFVIWDYVIDPTSVALTSGTGSLNGASRTAFVDVTSLDGASYSDPGIANVKTGTSYTYNGSSLTGTYTGSDRWSDPGVAYVSNGVQYKADSTTNNKTGTYNPAADVWANSKALTVAKFLGLK